MQVLKEELREEMLKKAESEFISKGFKGASMRVIAQKSHTTLGNLYNYFDNKEALLEAVIGDLPLKLEILFKEHEEPLVETEDIETINRLLDESGAEALGFEAFLSKPFVILMESCKGTKYETYRERFIEMGKRHVLGHLGDTKMDKLASMITISFLEAILFSAKHQKSVEEGREEFMQYFKMVIGGLMQYKK